MRQEAGMRMPKETALWERMHSRSSWLKSTPDNDGTGASLGQQLGQQGHVVAVVSFLSITFHHQAFHGPRLGDHILLGCTCVLSTDMQNRFSDSQTSSTLKMTTDTSNTNSRVKSVLEIYNCTMPVEGSWCWQ